MVEILYHYPYSLLVINIKNLEADRLARDLAQATGETITQAVTVAIRERLARVTGVRTSRTLADELDEIALRCANLPVIDDRTDDEILGYDERGLPRLGERPAS
ncbi:MAG: type II toxin-antitoxin system VapB family antitoxin [Pseudonocardiales bacterium]|nr:type II toxin-antitoxin system VapB family antitoxin [Pseudonocardiales bacterium]